MVHDHADLAAARRLIHIPVPVGKGSRVEATGEGYHKTSKPLFSYQVPLSQELQRQGGTEVLPVSRTTLSNTDITINHLTFAFAGRDILPYNVCKGIMRKSSQQGKSG